MTDHQSQASASQRFVLRRRPSSYHSSDAHSREEAKRGAIAAVLSNIESFKGKYHYGLFANDTQSLSDAQAALTHRLVKLVCAQHAHGASFGEFRIGIDGASLASFASEMKQKVTAERRFMPGYVLVHMEMSDRSYHLINSINRVTGFLGPQGRPMPMRDAEVNQILNRVQEGEDAPKLMISFDVGEKVKVNEGPFEDFDGMVEEVDDDNQRLKVTVSIFGRETPVELEFTQVTKQG